MGALAGFAALGALLAFAIIQALNHPTTTTMAAMMTREEEEEGWGVKDVIGWKGEREWEGGERMVYKRQR